MDRTSGNSPADSAGLTVDTAMPAGPLMQLRLLLSPNWLRIGPAWSVFAGASVAGASFLPAGALVRVAVAVALADLAWGMLSQLVGTAQSPPQDGPVPLVLPYAQPNSPLQRWAKRLAAGNGMSSPAAWQQLLGGLLLSAALASMLGTPALVLSAAACAAFALAWAIGQRGDQPALWWALVDVALPWLLGASLAWRGGEVRLALLLPHLALGGAFTLLQWGIRARVRARKEGALLAWVGQAALLAALIGLRQPWALMLAGVLLLPPSWALVARQVGSATLAWWWAAMAAVALLARF